MIKRGNGAEKYFIKRIFFVIILAAKKLITSPIPYLTRIILAIAQIKFYLQINTFKSYYYHPYPALHLPVENSVSRELALIII